MEPKLRGKATASTSTLSEALCTVCLRAQSRSVVEQVLEKVLQGKGFVPGSVQSLGGRRLDVVEEASFSTSLACDRSIQACC